MQESNKSMDQAQQALSGRVSQLETQISQINFQLTALNKRIKATKSSLGQRPLRQQALKLINKRKQLESMRDSIDSQSWTMQQAQMTNDNLQNTMITINALKQTNKSLKSQYGKIDLEKLQDMQDEMIDLIEQGNELQDVLATNNNIGVGDIDDIDDLELDAELDALAEEDLSALTAGATFNTNGTESAIPSYLSNTVPNFIDEDLLMETSDKALESAQ